MPVTMLMPELPDERTDLRRARIGPLPPNASGLDQNNAMGGNSGAPLEDILAEGENY